MTKINCVLFDFGDTLALEQWMLQSSAAYPEWESTYRREIWNVAEIGEQWGRGELASADIAQRMATALTISPEAAHQQMVENCKKLTYFPHIMAYVQKRRQLGMKQAILTLNADIFSDVVVPHYQLHTLFDVVVNSCHHGTLDKAELSQHVFAHYGGDIGFHNGLLIDNSQHHLDRFAAQGGATYLFTTDEQFASDLAAGHPLLAL
ncbi:MAG: hypothetical protein AAF614_12660 [Chloroflexota bacterium]